MTDLQLMQLLMRHCLVWTDLPDKTFCYIFDDRYQQRDIDTTQAQRFQDQGLLKPLPPIRDGDPIVQYVLSNKGWEALRAQHSTGAK